MYPSVYLYKETKSEFEIYLGGFSTLDGLSFISPDLTIQLIEVGATNYKQYGWATEKELPTFRTVYEITEFLKTEVNLGLIHFEILLNGIGKLRTHDDGECHFTFNTKISAIEYIESAAHPVYKNLILSELLDNTEIYITINASGQINKYYTFDQYLESSKRE